MKKVFILVLLVVPFLGYGQLDSISDAVKRSNAERLMNRSGFIKREFQSVGQVAKIKFDGLKVVDLVKQDSSVCVRMEFVISGYSISQTRICYIDEDEVPTVVKAINYLQEEVLNTTPKVNITDLDYTYETRSGVKIGVFWDKKKWICYLKADQYIRDNTVYFSRDELVGMSGLMEAAIKRVQ